MSQDDELILELAPASIGNIAEVCVAMGYTPIARDFGMEGRVEMDDARLRRYVGYLDALVLYAESLYPHWNDEDPRHDIEDEERFLDMLSEYYNDLAEALADVYGTDYRSRLS